MAELLKMPLSLYSISLTALTCVCLLYLTKILLAASTRGLRSIPGPLLAKFTNLHRFRLIWAGQAHENYRQLHEKYGPIVRTSPSVVDIADPKVIPIIYGINSKFYKSKFYDVFSLTYEGSVMHSMFTVQDTEEHKALKKPVASKFSMTSVKTLEYLVDPCSQIFHDAMVDMEGQVIDLGTWLQWYAFDAISAMTFSQRLGFMERREDVEHLIESIEFGLAYGGYAGRIPWIHKFLLGNQTLMGLRAKLMPDAPDPFRTITNKVRECLQEYDDVEKGHQERHDFLAFLRQQGKSTISDRDMMNHLINNFAAGSDTTAISLRAVFYYVLKDQRVYEKLRQEIDDAEQAGKLSTYITYAESLDLQYLQLCMKEAMRMHPGVSYPLERIVPKEGTELCGHYIPGGTIVGVNAATIHRNKDVFGVDADIFRPERWTEEGKSGDLKEMERTLLTFGAGARTCIGKNISIMEMGKLVPQVLRHFDLEWASEKPEWSISTYWFAKQSNLHVRFRKRQK